VLGETFGFARKKVRRGWKRLHNEKLHISYCAPDIIRMIKTRVMRWMWGIYTAWNRREIQRRF
jgi:hypothetical protein